jgi:hypothetical protein
VRCSGCQISGVEHCGRALAAVLACAYTMPL